MLIFKAVFLPQSSWCTLVTRNPTLTALLHRDWLSSPPLSWLWLPDPSGSTAGLTEASASVSLQTALSSTGWSCSPHGCSSFSHFPSCLKVGYVLCSCVPPWNPLKCILVHFPGNSQVFANILTGLFQARPSHTDPPFGKHVYKLPVTPTSQNNGNTDGSSKTVLPFWEGKELWPEN